ncbi:NADPH-dependent FMN reductase [Paenibacillus chartarius]|uniref:NADPH-dependent FMN reductase n=1 Tax=Paenibacillus chartarius TaxID=747481 RepID=A0ABV6DQQ3_9BACL
MSKVAIISGSPSASSRLNGLLQTIKGELEQRGAEVHAIVVRDIPPEDLVYTRFDSPAIVEANRLVESADAVIVATPVYKASYTGVLKAYLDLLPQKALSGKVTLPLAIGGSSAHLLIIDYALKPVLAALGAEHQLQGVYATDSHVQRGEDGSFALDDEVTERLRQAAAKLAEAIQSK